MPPKRPTRVGGAAREDGEKQINLGDTSSAKHTLDEAATEEILLQGYKEDHFVSNVKIVLGAISIALALVSQFWPGKFHENWWLVLGCVVGYTLVTIILTVFCSVKEGNAFLFTKKKKKGTAGLTVSSTLPRFSDMYTLRIESTAKGDSRPAKESTNSITKYFHADGYLSSSAFQDDVTKLLHSFEHSTKD
ncbi:unnamed protein product [Ostreobium quekettii]|uniref:Signal peptidase complex subunit 2 n=1 Tax=Ostreobium quekettii TaxID=121088 RepID=A0A8S1IRG4_9CHLO|nr:unnamed protein product [Ostreobium quekettii]|eukprot:evm.model.scf_136.2 EVM.evm.TU.scf_136.2   scf_136:15892-20613(+)